MKKYILIFFTFGFHNFTNTSLFRTNFVSDQNLVVNLPKVNDDVTKKVPVRPIDTVSIEKKVAVHSATWYNPHGAKTASGERFHKDSLTAAYNFSKMHSYLIVTNVSNGLSVRVRVTDRMGNKSRNHIDLSKCAFDSIGNPNSGRLKVTVEEIK